MHAHSPRRLLAAACSLIGPAGSALYETGHLRLFSGNPLHDVWLLVMIAAFGVGVGVVSFLRGAKSVGVLCILANLVVLLLYGFIGAFFALGGSR